MFKSERKVDRLNRVHGITTSRGHTTPSTKKPGEGWWDTVAKNHEYFAPTLLFAVMFTVLWFTDNKLGGYSYMTRDWWTFGAFVVVYFAFAPAFMQEKDKTKKTPLFKTAIVFITIMAVGFALIGNPANIFDWWWSRPNQQSTAQVAPSQVLKPAMRTIEDVAMPGIFSEVKIPGGCTFASHCQSGARVMFVHKNLPQGKIVDCEEEEKNPTRLVKVQDLSLFFIPTDPDPKWYRVELICS